MPALLPEGFEDLEPLAARWAQSDDAQRSQSEEDASTADLRALWAAVSPRLDAINAHLDAHDDEPDHRLGRLAEAAVEAALVLGQRTGEELLG